MTTSPPPLTTGQLLSFAMKAARQRVWLVVPLVLAELLATLFGLVPLVVLLGRALRLVDGEPLLLGLGLFGAVTEPRTLWTLAAGALLAVIVAWLLRAAVHAGALGSLSDALGGEPEDEKAFGRAWLETPENWLAAAAFTTLLRGFSVVAIFGIVFLGMQFFTTNPGVLAALAMTVACAAVVAGPLIVVALELAFARAVLLGEGPLEATGQGLIQGFRRRDALIPAWFLLVVLDLAVAIAAGIGSSVLQGLGPEPTLQILLLGPRAAWWVMTAVVFALVMLLRLGLYATLVREEQGTLPRPVVPPPLPVRPSEPVFEAHPVPEAHESPAPEEAPERS